MNRLSSWLAKEAKTSSLLYVSPILVMIQILFFSIIVLLYTEQSVVYGQNTGGFTSDLEQHGAVYTQSKIFVWAFLEEVIFRMLPFGILAVIIGAFELNKIYFSENLKAFLVILVVISSSILFGWSHGNAYNLLLQGVGGIVLSIVYVKYGWWQNKPLKSVMAATFVHALYNSTILWL